MGKDLSESYVVNGIFESEISFETDTQINEPINLSQQNQPKKIDIKVKYKLNNKY